MKIPLGQFICVTGVSGSGKSTLINETLYPILNQHVYKAVKKPLAYKSIKGLEYIDKIIDIDQSPIGRTPRSNPATYTGVFTDIRLLYSNLPDGFLGYSQILPPCSSTVAIWSLNDSLSGIGELSIYYFNQIIRTACLKE